MYSGRVGPWSFFAALSSPPHAPSALAAVSNRATRVVRARDVDIAGTLPGARRAPTRGPGSRQQADDVVEAGARAQLCERQPRGVAVIWQRLERAETQAQVIEAGCGPLQREARQPLRRRAIERVVVARGHQQDDPQRIDEVDLVAELGGR